MSENNNTIYILYPNRFREGPPLCISTRMLGLRTAIETLIHDGSVHFFDEQGEHYPGDVEEIRAFRASWKDMTRTEMNERLSGVFIDTTVNGALN